MQNAGLKFGFSDKNRIFDSTGILNEVWVFDLQFKINLSITW